MKCSLDLFSLLYVVIKIQYNNHKKHDVSSSKTFWVIKQYKNCFHVKNIILCGVYGWLSETVFRKCLQFAGILSLTYPFFISKCQTQMLTKAKDNCESIIPVEIMQCVDLSRFALHLVSNTTEAGNS